MSPLATLDLNGLDEDDSPAQLSSDPRLNERNKILKVAMTLVGLVAGIAPFVNYLTLELPILGAHEATLADSFTVAAKVRRADTSPVVQTDFLNVRKGPGIEYPAMGQILKGEKVTVAMEKDGWLKIATSQGEGWIDGRYVSSPLDSMNVGDLRTLLNKDDINPKLAEGFRRLPPYSAWLPAIALVLLACSLVFLPFTRNRREIASLRIVVFAWTVLSLYALVFHLLFVQTFRNTLADISGTAATNLGQTGVIDSLAGMAALAFTSNIRVHVGPALYILAASGAVMSSLSLFLIPTERHRVIRPYIDSTEPRKYLDL